MSDTNRFEILFENNPHPTWVYDVESLLFLEVNRAAVRNLGYSRDEFLAMRITDIRPQEDVSNLLVELRKERPVVRSSERRYRCKDGRVIPVQVTSHLAELNGRTVAVVVAEDITVRKQAHEMLIRAKEEAERAMRFKDQFLSTMSHELRTPLNAILGFSELITDERYGTLNQRQHRYIDHIHSSGRHLLQLINDILDLSKIEAGRLELAPEVVRVGRALGEVVSVLGPLAARKSQTLSEHADPNLYVRADATRLRQILLNLAGNAIKFTPEGGRVQLEAVLEDSQVRIQVRDTGPGIPPEEQERIFQAFYRQQNLGTPVEGTGLGLAIAQRLVELHGGRLCLESRLGQGSCFYFSLPQATEVVNIAERRGSLRSLAGKVPRILVVDDDAVSSQLIQSQLVSSGYDVICCREPQRALQMAADYQPNAVTLDPFTKPLNGWEVLLELKADKRTMAIPVIMVTIVDQPAVGAILGVDEYLVKPVEKNVLVDAIERCIRSRQGAPSGQHVLLVEDDDPTREVVTELLEGHGYTVRTAADGAQALLQVNLSLPSLVILDLLLPKVSGFELIAEWRSTSRTADLPIFVITSKDLSRDETKYLRANAEFLVHKQQDWQETLIQQLSRAVPNRHQEVS